MKNKLWKFIKELEPRLLPEPFGRFNITECNKTYAVECELLTQLENPFINTELKKCKVDKESFKNEIKNKDSIIFY